jgi:hypothetical protein
MAETTEPGAICSVPGCQEPVANTPRSPAADEVLDAPPGEIVPLCADHAEQANAPEVADP